VAHLFYTGRIAKLNAPTELDLYAVLDVRPEASDDDIRRQYKRLAKAFHPDLNPDPAATARMKNLNEAYAVLGDRDRRAAYDTLAGFQRWADERFGAPRAKASRSVERYADDLDTELSIPEMLSRKRAAADLEVRKTDFRLYYVSSMDRRDWYRVSVDTGCHCPDSMGLAGPFGCKHWFAMEAFRNNGDVPRRQASPAAR